MHVLAIDIGTSSCKVGLFSPDGLVRAASRALTIISPRSGFAQLDPDDVWRTVKSAVAEVLSGGMGGDVAALSFSSLGEAFVPVRSDGTAVGPSILSFDTRGSRRIQRFRETVDEAFFFSINPNPIGPHLSLAKMLWLKECRPEVFRAADKFLLWADFLAYRFGAEPFTSNSLANRTMLFDVKRGEWSEALVARAGMDPGKLAPIVSGGALVGTVDPRVAGELGIRKGAAIVAGGHDQCCNALGCGCVRPGDTVVGMGTYETYCPVFAWPGDTGSFRREGMNIEHHVVDGLYVSFLHHYSGLLVNWFLSTFAKHESADGDAIDILNAEIPDAPGSLLFLPYNEPPQWPEYLDNVSGAFVGLKSDTTRGEMFLAVLEGIAFFFTAAVEAMSRMGIRPGRLIASGGGARSDKWMQIRADIIGIPFTRTGTREGSMNGAAILAATGAGIFSDVLQGVERFVVHERTFHPDPARHRRYGERLALYRALFPALEGIMRRL